MLLFVLSLYVPFDIFSHVGMSSYLPGLNQDWPCSKTHHSTSRGCRTSDPFDLECTTLPLNHCAPQLKPVLRDGISFNIWYVCLSTVKPVLSGHSKEDQKLVFKTNYHLMQVKSIKGEHSALLSTFIKLPFVIKIFVVFFFYFWVVA